jgi:hypothetical protein
MKCIGKNFKYDVIENNESIIQDAFFQKNIKTSACSKIYRKSFLDRYNLTFYDGIINEDTLFTMLCSIYAHKVVFLNIPLYYIRVRPGSISRTFKEENITSYSIIFEEIENVLKKNNIYVKYEKYYYGSYTKQILFSLIQCILNTRSTQQFLKLYNLLNNGEYMNKEMGKNIKYCSLLYYVIYRISLHPVLFFYLVSIIKFLGYKKY